MSAITDPSATSTDSPTPQAQTGQLLTQVAGYMAVRIIDIGSRAGLLQALAHSPGTTADELSEQLELDPFYILVWCRGAFGAGILERVGTGFALAPHMETLLLNPDAPGYAGGLFPLVRQPEMFDRFDEHLASGQRLWWDETSPEWIAGVAATGRPFYTRLIPGGLSQVDGLGEQLESGCRVLDTSCGVGIGLIRLAEHYPQCTVVGVDGDRHSIDTAQETAAAAGVSDRVSTFCSPLEELTVDEPFDVVINNISMHECRDIDVVTERIKAALRPGGTFVISDFPFPDTDEGLRSVPGRIMSGIQFFEAQIDDQLMPRKAYDTLLADHSFVDLGWFALTPVHAVTYGRRPS